MKIIKRGVLPEEQVRQETCDACKTVFEFSMKEVTISDDRSYNYYYINCPLCKKVVYVK